MEYIVKNVVSIDKEAENYKQFNKKSLQLKKQELDSELDKIKGELEIELSLEKKKILEDSIRNAQYEANSIRVEKEKKLMDISFTYKKNKYNLVEQIFDDIKNSMKEG